MSKEELFDQGWDIVYSGPCGIEAWGKWMIHLTHALKGRVSGYGIDENTALTDAAATIQKPLENKNEIRH